MFELRVVLDQVRGPHKNTLSATGEQALVLLDQPFDDTSKSSRSQDNNLEVLGKIVPPQIRQEGRLGDVRSVIAPYGES